MSALIELAEDPLWFKRAVFYELSVRAFHDGNDDGIGDFAGLIGKLEYLEWLGVDCVWLLPFQQSPLRDGGYDISDYRTVLADYGNVDDVARLVDEAHQRGIRVIMDLVINHTSDQHAWFKSARSSPDSEHRDWYMWSSTKNRFTEARIIFIDTETSNWTWDEEAGACRESWDRAWRATEAYRGANSNMHAVEAFLAAGQVTGDESWTRRALRIAERLVHHEAGGRGWRLPEHYSASWEVEPDYNLANRADRFRPYGVTIGHLVEWARLLIHLELALASAPEWLTQTATAMFDSAMRLGWEADGAPGLVYTVDWDDKPVIAERSMLPCRCVAYQAVAWANTTRVAGVSAAGLTVASALSEANRPVASGPSA